MDNFGDKYFKRVEKICTIQVILNYILTGIKLAGGIIGNSGALINDGINSLGDIITSSVGLFGTKAASKKADKEHQFGHEKIESLICTLLGMCIIFVAGVLIYSSIISLINKEYLSVDHSSILVALIIAISALLIKGGLCLFTFFNYKVTNSSLLKTQAFDHLSDSVSTIISLISIVVIMCVDNPELNIIDPIGSLIIAILIVIGGIKILIENCSLLLDRAADKELESKIYSFISKINGVEHIDALRSRLFGNRLLLEVEISVKDELTVKEAHDISEEVRIKVLNSFSEVKHVLVHVNPLEHKDESDL